MKFFHLIKEWYVKYERHISSASLICGFIWNAIFLKRVDFFWENFWVIIHIIIIGACIILINRYENIRIKTDSKSERVNLHFWLITIMQFTFGGLLSTYLVFYFRSTTLAVTWPFLLILAVAFIANERFKHHYDRLIFQISLYYVALFSFSIFFVPVIIKQIGTNVFIISGLVSLIFIALFLLGLERIAKERFRDSKRNILLSIIGIFISINILYFLNLIPPIPISLKDAGVYHNIYKNSKNEYLVESEVKPWYDYFTLHKSVHIVRGETMYAYSAIFSPAEFRTDIVHIWEHYDDNTNKWDTVNVVNLSAIGGREGGYRTYSKKSNLESGSWRVDVETKSGQVIGRIRFEVDYVEILPVLIDEVKY